MMLWQVEQGVVNCSLWSMEQTRVKQVSMALTHVAEKQISSGRVNDLAMAHRRANIGVTSSRQFKLYRHMIREDSVMPLFFAQIYREIKYIRMCAPFLKWNQRLNKVKRARQI